jgi:hypothetical protein
MHSRYGKKDDRHPEFSIYATRPPLGAAYAANIARVIMHAPFWIKELPHTNTWKEKGVGQPINWEDFHTYVIRMNGHTQYLPLHKSIKREVWKLLTDQPEENVIDSSRRHWKNYFKQIRRRIPWHEKTWQQQCEYMFEHFEREESAKRAGQKIYDTEHKRIRVKTQFKQDPTNNVVNIRRIIND